MQRALVAYVVKSDADAGLGGGALLQGTDVFFTSRGKLCQQGGGGQRHPQSVAMAWCSQSTHVQFNGSPRVEEGGLAIGRFGATARRCRPPARCHRALPCGFDACPPTSARPPTPPAPSHVAGTCTPPSSLPNLPLPLCRHGCSTVVVINICFTLSGDDSRDRYIKGS